MFYRELAFHQIGSHLNLYKTMMLGQSPPPAVPSSAPTPSSRGSSFMFSCEDIMVDTTSILKDARHPSHTHLGQGQTHRVVSLNRTQSAVGDVTARSTRRGGRSAARHRFYSESERDLNRNMSFCSLANRDSKISLVGSTELVADLQTNHKKFKVQPTHSFRSSDGRASSGGDPAAKPPFVDQMRQAAEPARAFEHIRPGETGKDYEPVKTSDDDTLSSDKVSEKAGGYVTDRSIGAETVPVNKDVPSKCDMLKTTFEKYINLRLCSNPVFLVLACSVMMMAVGMPHCLFFLPTYVESTGLSRDGNL